MRAQEAIDYCRIMAGDEHGDIHTDAKMLLHLNRVLRDISTRSRCIVEGLYLPAREGQSLYGLPEDFLRLDIAAWIQSDGRYRPMDPITMDIASWSVHNEITGRPRYFDVFGRAAVERAKNEVVHRIGLPPIHEDAHDTITLEGSLNRFVEMKPGDRIVNVSDGSSTGYILHTQRSLDATTNRTIQTIAYTELEGGIRGYLQTGDHVRILSPGAPRHSLVVSPVPTDVGEIGHEALFTYTARAHRKITQQHIQDENDDIELDIEFETALVEYVTYRMMRAESNTIDADLQAQKVEAETAYRDALPDVLDRIRQWKIMWFRRQGLRAPNVLNAPVRVKYPIGIGGEEVR